MVHEFRGDLTLFNEDELDELYARVAKLKKYEERAYCVTSGINQGVAFLSFAYKGDQRLKEAYGVTPSSSSCLTRPVVCVGGGDYAAYAIDVLPELPELPPSILTSVDNAFVQFREHHMATYFNHFRDVVDQRTLLLR